MKITWQSGYVQSGSVKIRYQRAGRGIPFVMAHGFSDNGDCWKAWAERHFVADYDVVLLDARNHG
ncbi:MAG: alpha/beta fold hydrolase, partial [Roseiflexaceae bacterium]